jgi:hypothetical protein
MAGNSLESLLAWMKDNSRMLGWDLIVSLDGRMINQGLRQDHTTRLSRGTDLGSFSGSVDICQTNISQHLSGFRLAAPLLSFGDASFQTNKTALSLAVAGGTQMMVETVQGQKRILELSEHDPRDGMQVTLELPLTADARNVLLDLKDSEEVKLTMVGSGDQQRATGALFKAWFDSMDDEKRVHTVATFPGEGNPLMSTRRLDVRTQKRDVSTHTPATVDERGAVVLFASMNDGSSGNFPGDNSGFKDLIPDDDAQHRYSATELFSQALIHRAAFGQAVLQLLDDAAFDHIAGEGGALARLVARAGSLPVPRSLYETSEYEFNADPFSLSAVEGALPLTVEFDRNLVTQRWQSTFTLPFRYRPLKGTDWKDLTGVFNINLQHEFRLWADESGVSAMEGELSTPYTETHEVEVVSGLPAMGSNELEQIRDFVANTVKRAILERFSNTLTTTASETYLEEVEIVGASTLQASHVALPFDLAVFGQINPAGSAFSIAQQQPLMIAGETLKFTTEPERSGLSWVVESLPGSASEPGSIDPQTGVYEAPPGHAIAGSFNRVLVAAIDPDTDERSVTLLTVQVNPITINPQIYECYFGDSVELSAVDLHGNELVWSIKNPIEGESGKLVVNPPGGSCTYTAGPRVPGKNYVLEEIEVRDRQGTRTRSAYVLVIQNDPLVVVKPVGNPGLGQVQLQAFFDGEPVDGQWRLPIGGPGYIDDGGLYSDDPMAKTRFVLVYVSAQVIGRTFLGHIILPLPFEEFTFLVGTSAQ